MNCRRVHHRKEPYDIFIGRPSKWSNPFSNKLNSNARYKTKSRKESVEKHKEWLINGDGQYLLKDLHELKGKILGCWCDNGSGSTKNKTCHGDIIVKLVNDLDKPKIIGLDDFFK